MSIKLMTMVWMSDLAPTDRYLLLALADHANDDGEHVYPKVSTLVEKTGLARRSVQRILRRFEDEDLLVDTGERTASGVYIYRISVATLRTHLRKRGATESPPIEVGATESRPRGDRESQGDDRESPHTIQPSVNPQGKQKGNGADPLLIWKNAKGYLQATVPSSVFDIHIQFLRPVCDNGGLKLVAPNRESAEFVTLRLMPKIIQAIRMTADDLVTVEVTA